jgi:hypothetical protein
VEGDSRQRDIMNMIEPEYISELKKYGAGDPTESDIKALENELFDGPDRAAAIVLGALAEKAIVKLLSLNMKDDANGAFGTKIAMAYSRGLFGRQTEKDLTIIRHLRNQFAHSRKPIEFTTQVVRKCCDELTYPDAPGVHVPFNLVSKVSDHRLEDAADKSHPRTRYFISVHEITQRIYFIRSGDELDPRNHLL